MMSRECYDEQLVPWNSSLYTYFDEVLFGADDVSFERLQYAVVTDCQNQLDVLAEMSRNPIKTPLTTGITLEHQPTHSHLLTYITLT